MTIAEFNSLPLEARNFIKNNAGCLACGNSEAKLTKGYNLYLISKKMKTFILFGGGVNYSQDGQKGILSAVRANDTPDEIRTKIRIAKAVHAKSPHLFSAYDEKAMDELLDTLPKEKVINLDFDVKTATYNELLSYVNENNIETQGTKKAALIEAIEAHECDLM